MRGSWRAAPPARSCVPSPARTRRPCDHREHRRRTGFLRRSRRARPARDRPPVFAAARSARAFALPAGWYGRSSAFGVGPRPSSAWRPLPAGPDLRPLLALADGAPTGTRLAAALHATLHSVPAAPSSSTMPARASSSRMRSAVAKSLFSRALARSAISCSMRAPSAASAALSCRHSGASGFDAEHAGHGDHLGEAVPRRLEVAGIERDVAGPDRCRAAPRAPAGCRGRHPSPRRTHPGSPGHLRAPAPRARPG